MNALAPIQAPGLPATFDPAALDAALAGMMNAQDEAAKSRTSITKIKSAGTYRIRILPNGDPSTVQWWASFAIHFFEKGLVGNEKALVFNSAKHSLGLDNDPIQLACQKAFTEVKRLQAINPTQANALDTLVRKVNSGPSYLVNAMIVPDGHLVGPIIALQTNKGFLDELFQVARMVSQRFFTFQTNSLLVVKVEPRTQGAKGFTFKVISREPEVDLGQLVGQNGFKMEDLKILSSVVVEATGNALPPSAFSGDLFSPLKAAPPAAQAGAIGYTQPTAAPAIAYPAQPVTQHAYVQPAPQPVYVQPAPQYAPAPVQPVYAQPTQQYSPAPVQPTYAPATIEQSAYAPAPVQPVTYAAPGIVLQQPGYAPPTAPPMAAAPVANAFVAQPAPVAQPQAAPQGQPAVMTQAQVNDLESRLLGMVK